MLHNAVSFENNLFFGCTSLQTITFFANHVFLFRQTDLITSDSLSQDFQNWNHWFWFSASWLSQYIYGALSDFFDSSAHLLLLDSRQCVFYSTSINLNVTYKLLPYFGDELCVIVKRERERKRQINTWPVTLIGISYNHKTGFAWKQALFLEGNSWNSWKKNCTTCLVIL